MDEFEHGTFPVFKRCGRRAGSVTVCAESGNWSIAQAVHHKIDFQHVLGVSRKRLKKEGNSPE
ncbi:MAG: hypothetical protein WBF07_10270 [Xanthobacteraceae bacterium]